MGHRKVEGEWEVQRLWWCTLWERRTNVQLKWEADWGEVARENGGEVSGGEVRVMDNGSDDCV